jgi:predicted nucleic acid-binding protein
MCLIVDVNALSCCFDKSDLNHDQFEPVLDWVLRGRGKIVYGGSKYKSEIKKAHKYLRILRSLDQAGKIVKVDDHSVDEQMSIVARANKDPDFDDPHLIAIVIVSGCRIVCTNDRRALRFLKNKDFYPGATKRPKIYTSRKNTGLLKDSNIADACRPCIRLNKEQMFTIGN